MDHSRPGFSVHGLLQARTLEWVTCPPLQDLPDQSIKPPSLSCLALASRFFTTSTIKLEKDAKMQLITHNAKWELYTWKLLSRHTEDFNRFEFKVLTVNKEKFHHIWWARVPGGSDGKAGRLGLPPAEVSASSWGCKVLWLSSSGLYATHCSRQALLHLIHKSMLWGTLLKYFPFDKSSLRHPWEPTRWVAGPLPDPQTAHLTTTLWPSHLLNYASFSIKCPFL